MSDSFRPVKANLQAPPRFGASSPPPPDQYLRHVGCGGVVDELVMRGALKTRYTVFQCRGCHLQVGEAQVDRLLALPLFAGNPALEIVDVFPGGSE